VETSSYKILDINVNHPIRATQLAIDSFKRQKLGHSSVVLISSIAAQSANFTAPLYTASKWAISGFVRSVSHLEKFMNVRVTAVAPGIVKTPLWKTSTLKDAVDEEVDTLVLPEQIAQIMLDLIQKEENVGGTILEVGADDVRRVERLNDPGPQGKKGCTVSKVLNVYVDTEKLIESEFGK
jgi:3-hydroxybutyrate dehydrogenase